MLTIWLRRRFDARRQAGARSRGADLYTFLYGILLNLDRRHRRRAGLKKRKLRVLWGNEPASASRPPLRRQSKSPSGRKPLVRSGEVARGQREAWCWRFASHLQYDEIAEVMECPVRPVKSRIFHGLAALRGMLSGQEEHEAGQIPPHAWGI